MPRITLQGLRKAYRAPANRGEAVALDDVSLDVADGELLTVLGPSGSGKTTLLRLIAGLDPLSGGRIQFDGRDMAVVAPGQRGVAMVSQRGALFPHLNTRDNLALGLRLRRWAQRELAARVAETAERLGIECLLERMPGTLSVGERQRVALGRALATRPSVLLLDEPLAALDAPLRVQLRREIGRLHSQGGLTVLHVTHDQDEALSLGSRVAVLRAGALQQVGEPQELVERAANLFVAGFVGSPPMNLLTGWLIRDAAGLRFVAALGEPAPTPGLSRPPCEGARRSGEGGLVASADARKEPGALELRLPAGAAQRLDSHAGQAVVLGVRVGDVQTSVGGSSGNCLRFDAAVESVELAGGRWVARLGCGGQGVMVGTDAADRLRPGQRVTATVSPDQACWFDAATGRRLWP